MTIQKGQPWGHSCVVPLTTRDVDSDWQLARGFQQDIHVLSGGDLYTALGRPSPMRPNDTRTMIQIDAMECTITDDTSRYSLLASATIEIGRWISFGRSRRYVAITNGGLLDGKNIAPRAHPNDAHVDVMTIDASMALRDRFMSVRRANTGAHVPHPEIDISRGDFFAFNRQFDKERLTIDRQVISSWNKVEIRVIPDYWQVIV